MATRSFSASEVYTKEVQYTFEVYPLKSVQWHMIRRTSALSLALGAAFGALVSFAIPLIVKVFREKPVVQSDWDYVIASAALSIIFVILGLIADRKRSRVIKKIDAVLLSDEQLDI